MIIYYKFDEMPYMSYDRSGRFERGRKVYYNYEYEYEVDVSPRDIAEFLCLNTKQYDEVFRRLIVNELIDVENDDFRDFMYDKYHDKAFEKCARNLLEGY